MVGKYTFGRNAWLIAYDIADPGRLGKVHRLLKQRAIPLQYSVFLAWLSKQQINQLVAEINLRINSREDDVRLYHLPQTTEITTLGKQWLPDGTQFLHCGNALQMELPLVNFGELYVNFREP